MSIAGARTWLRYIAAMVDAGLVIGLRHDVLLWLAGWSVVIQQCLVCVACPVSIFTRSREYEQIVREHQFMSS